MAYDPKRAKVYRQIAKDKKARQREVLNKERPGQRRIREFHEGRASSGNAESQMYLAEDGHPDYAHLLPDDHEFDWK